MEVHLPASRTPPDGRPQPRPILSRPPGSATHETKSNENPSKSPLSRRLRGVSGEEEQVFRRSVTRIYARLSHRFAQIGGIFCAIRPKSPRPRGQNGVFFRAAPMV